MRQKGMTMDRKMGNNNTDRMDRNERYLKREEHQKSNEKEQRLVIFYVLTMSRKWNINIKEAMRENEGNA